MLPISVCIIAKNEEQYIGQCLKPLREVFHEIILVDTGSSDRTTQIAARYTELIYHFDWIDDFSAARNFSLSKASNDWILCVDCDEFLLTKPREIKGLSPLLSKPGTIGLVKRKNPQSSANGTKISMEYISRLFSKSHFHFEGLVHEQLIPLGGGGKSFRKVPLEFYHAGYADAATLQKKSGRNLPLLLSQMSAQGEDPYLLFQIGQCHYSIQQYEEALTYFDKGLSYDLNPSLEYVRTMVENYGYCLINTKRYAQALSLAGVYDEFSCRSDFVFLMGLIYMNNGLFEQAIEEFRLATKAPEQMADGVGSYRAYYNIGLIHELTGGKEKAREYYLKCGDFSPAKERLRLL
jgi:glycosyltransferase involved in cell wall biosynthesis